MEELFTQDRIGPDAREAFIAALEHLSASGLVFVVATMRADFFDALAESPRLAALSGGEARFLLLPPRDGEIGEIIRLPALEAGLRFEARTETGEALDETIRPPQPPRRAPCRCCPSCSTNCGRNEAPRAC